MPFGIKFNMPISSLEPSPRTWDKDLKAWLEDMEARQEYLRKRYRETAYDANPPAPPLTDEEIAEHESIENAVTILRHYMTPEDKEAREIIREAAKILSDDAT